MKKILFFYQDTCPYCIKGMRYLDELRAENPEYGKLDIEMIEERRESERAEKYDYWYVPTIYADGEKLHEGALSKEKLKAVLNAALA